MAKITYIEHNGTEHVVDAKSGMTVMEAAVKNMVPGIDAECGGACACATCHVMVGEEWWNKLPEIAADEEMMLDIGLEERSERSRLACQIELSDELEGIVVRMPESQI